MSKFELKSVEIESRHGDHIGEAIKSAVLASVTHECNAWFMFNGRRHEVTWSSLRGCVKEVSNEV